MLLLPQTQRLGRSRNSPHSRHVPPLLLRPLSPTVYKALQAPVSSHSVRASLAQERNKLRKQRIEGWGVTAIRVQQSVSGLGGPGVLALLIL